MKKNTSSNLYFIAGFLFVISAIINFFSTKSLNAMTNVGLAIVFLSLGYNNRKNNK